MRGVVGSERAERGDRRGAGRSAALAAPWGDGPGRRVGRLWEIFWVPKHSEHLTLDATAQKSLSVESYQLWDALLVDPSADRELGEATRTSERGGAAQESGPESREVTADVALVRVCRGEDELFKCGGCPTHRASWDAGEAGQVVVETVRIRWNWMLRRSGPLPSGFAKPSSAEPPTSHAQRSNSPAALLIEPFVERKRLTTPERDVQKEAEALEKIRREELEAVASAHASSSTSASAEAMSGAAPAAIQRLRRTRPRRCASTSGWRELDGCG